MSNQPFYHLRLNKYIDRNLFIQTLIGLNSQFPISEYKYTGFGSYLFDDFKLLHDALNINSMTSLEMDSTEYQRAVYNVPYGCINIKNISSTEYISQLSLSDGEHNIFWLDFVSPTELGTQLSDFASLLNLLNPNDIIRITLNANPGALGKHSEPDKLQEVRLEKLRSRVKEEYLPHNLKSEDVTRQKYPITLLEILKAVTLESLTDSPPYSPNFLLPIFSSVYSDGQQMLTFTGIVLDSHDKEELISRALAKYPHNNFSWDKPCRISVPPLTVREMLEINKLLPDTVTQQQLIKIFPFIFSEKDSESVESYISYYKYYPHFHQVSF